MIFCIPASESKGLDSRFEPNFGKAVSMVIYNTDADEVREVPVNTAAKGAKVPAYFEIVLCGQIDRDVWRDYLYQGVRFFGVGASTVREALEKGRKGDIIAVRIAATEPHVQERAHAGGCGCGRHGHGGHHHDAANHACCGGKGHNHGMGACGGHGKGHGGCGCG